MRNIEIKGKVTDYDSICKIAEELSGAPPTVLNQEDTFYQVNNGRLKMRFENNTATLVRYDRKDESGPKLSEFDLLKFENIEQGRSLDEILKKSLGLRGKVEKERKLYMVGQTRVHIDSVKGLGNFMELEVVLREEQSTLEGQIIARDLQKKLGVTDEDLIEFAYMDLLENLKYELLAE